METNGANIGDDKSLLNEDYQSTEYYLFDTRTSLSKTNTNSFSKNGYLPKKGILRNSRLAASIQFTY